MAAIKASLDVSGASGSTPVSTLLPVLEAADEVARAWAGVTASVPAPTAPPPRQ